MGPAEVASSDAVSARTPDGSGGPAPVDRGTRSPAELAGPGPADPRGWALWRAPGRVVAYVLAVDALALLTVLLVPTDPVDPRDLVTAGALALGAVLHIEVARHIERLREIETDGRAYVDLKSMWSFAGLLLLPLGPALGLVVVTFAFWYLRVSRRPPPHRWVFSGATVLLGTTAAWAVLGLAPGGAVLAPAAGPLALVVVSAAALTRWAVNHGLVVGVISLSAPAMPWRQRLGGVSDIVLGLGALALGIVLAVLVQQAPWLVPVLLVPLLTMHRGFLVQQLARAAHTDDKTGLATAAHWHADATRALARARRARGGLGVLMIDLDDFKRVNDTHGHLVGDRVLRAVADVLTAEIRPGDRAGRFGGEEFVVLLDRVCADHVAVVAERLRRRVHAVSLDVTSPDGPGALAGLSVSIGVGLFPGAARTVDDLLLAADGALYEAKRAGRDRVCFAPGR